MPQPEVWMRGPIDGVPPLLQPVAHALLQAGEELQHLLQDFDERLLWIKPAGLASAGFHLLHIRGVIDRLFTYAKEQSLTEAQLTWLQSETTIIEGATPATLLSGVQQQIHAAIEQLKDTDEKQLTAVRYLGRKRIPTTLTGLLFHAAEHIQRHVGQLLVTVKFVKAISC